MVFPAFTDATTELGTWVTISAVASGWDGGIRSRSATPRFHDCEHSTHRKVALQPATGGFHPRMLTQGFGSRTAQSK